MHRVQIQLHWLLVGSDLKINQMMLGVPVGLDRRVKYLSSAAIWWLEKVAIGCFFGFLEDVWQV